VYNSNIVTYTPNSDHTTTELLLWLFLMLHKRI
jgi:hypothetical protein